MSCFHPWIRDKSDPDRGGWDSLPCGHCIGCLSDRSRQWSIRCLHESSLHSSSSFLTLTYDDSHLIYGSTGATLVPQHLVDFFKRLRHSFKFRYFACGEYGTLTHRPHYHVLLFGYDFSSDRIAYNSQRSDSINKALYTSNLLSSKWSHGHCVIGDVSIQSIAYVTRYLLKKAQARGASRPSRAHRPDLCPEFQVMSRRPGLGSGWYQQFSGDLFPHDNVVLPDGKTAPIPRFYANKYKLTNPFEFENVVACRKLKFVHQDRRNAAEAIQQARTDLYAPKTI